MGGKREKAVFGCTRGLRQERAVHLSRWAEAAEQGFVKFY
jgi:hypothetical protein